MGVAHEPHQDRQRHPLTDHVRGEGVSKAMGVGLTDPGADSVVAEKPAQSRGRHGAAPSRSLEVQEDGVVTAGGALAVEIGRERLAHVGSEGEDPVPVPLPRDPDLLPEEVEVLESEDEDLAGAQATEEHQCGDGEIAGSAKALEESHQLLANQGHDQAAGDLDAKGGTAHTACGSCADPRRLDEEGNRLRWHLCSPRQVPSGLEAVETAEDAQAKVDRAGSRWTSL